MTTNNEDITLITTSVSKKMNGVAFPVIEGLGGFFTRSEGAETIMSGMKQLLLTGKGERAMNPEFGTNLRKAVFEPFDEELKNTLRADIETAILEYEPRVDLETVSIEWDESNRASGYNQIYVRVLFRIKEDLSEPQVLEIIV